jgi:GntR family transcriptional regulator
VSQPPTTAIDRQAPIPLYHQLKQILLRTIETQGLTAGDRLPTEAQLEVQYGVSRATIRQAIKELEAEGVVERMQGRGTFIAAPRLRHVAMLSSFAEDMRSQGHVASRTMLESSTIEANKLVAAALQIAEGSACYWLRRLLFADGIPIGLADTWLPLAVLGGHERVLDSLGDGSLYEALLTPPIAIALARGAETVTAHRADAPTAELLACPEDTALLVVERLAFDVGEQVVERTRTVFLADRYEYRVAIVRPGSRTE